MNTMDLKLNREMLSMTRTILDASCEQAVEKDFLLPDYYPDIFRVLKCVITPTVQSHSHWQYIIKTTHIIYFIFQKSYII